MSQSRTPRYVVLETSALLGLLNNFSNSQGNAPAALKGLVEQGYANGGHALLDRIFIPDHVLYELTGILPMSYPRMMEQFVSCADNPAELDKAIDFYTDASVRWKRPRSKRERNRVKENNPFRNQVRALIAFVAEQAVVHRNDEHPVILPTKVAEQFCQRLKIDQSIVATVTQSDLSNYRPRFSDAYDILGGEFQASNLRLHLGQLYMMGLISETQYNTAMKPKKNEKGEEEVEAPLARKRRFMKVREFADQMRHNGRLGDDKRSTSPNHASILKLMNDIKAQAKSEVMELFNHDRSVLAASLKGKVGKSDIRRQVAELKTKAELEVAYRQDRAEFLTVGFLEQYAKTEDLFVRYHRPGRNDNVTNVEGRLKRGRNLSSAKDHVRYALQEARLLVEHYFYGGILPMEAMFDVARTLGYKVIHHENHDIIREDLYNQGFFERSMTVQDLQKIRDELSNKRYAKAGGFRALDDFMARLPEQIVKNRAKFDDQCRHPNPMELLSQDTNIQLPDIGTPYESMFAEAVVDGIISLREFVDILQETGNLIEGPGNDMLHDNGEHILVSTGFLSEKDATISVRMDGFISREGQHQVLGDGASRSGELSIGDSTHQYWHFAGDELIAACRRKGGGQMTYVLESLLYPAVSQSASNVRDVAQRVLGEERVIQLEKDFSTQIVRDWKKHLPPYTNTFAAQHVRRRVSRKSLGEIATAEAAVALARQHSDASVWLVNHDSDLFPDLNDEKAGRPIRFSNSVRRMHSDKMVSLTGLESDMAELNARKSEEPVRGSRRAEKIAGLHFVNTEQFLKTVESIVPRPDQSQPMTIEMSRHIASHKNHAWQNYIQEEAAKAGRANTKT